ncbi:hypothetical protein [Paraburkholderia caribensis]|uniref:hypothetical protein n=1 Tax=Paraburkholderia caribensis TaxID=75105 RepID=UPI001D084FE9|nr:hypothetical protein [Paraburkholderia caribensis]
MAKLAGEQIYLLLNRSTDLRGHEIRAVSSVDAALQVWDSTTRMSPLFPIDDAAFPSTEGDSRWFIFFIGPVDIGTLDLEGIRAFASYGMHNLVVVSTVDKDPSVEQLLTSLPNTPWEAWEVVGTEVKDVAFSTVVMGTRAAERVGVAAKPAVPPQLKSASEEYRTLNAVTRAKCERYLPQFVADIDAFDEAFQKALNDGRRHAVDKLAYLANVNAALSRFSSQTFAGTSPIRETECHFWTHSLLGIGTATQALTNIRRHHDAAFRASRLPEKVAGLAHLPPGDKELTRRGFTHAAWRRHLLEDVVLEDEPKTVDDYLKLIAYFSGRDGYKSTTFTLSAPLELITGCNTFAWTPLTLTHELSHTITSQLLGTLLKDLFLRQAAGTMEFYARLVNPSENYAPQSALEQAQKTLLMAFVFLDREQLADQEQASVVDAASVMPLIQRYYDEMVELVTHLLDFQYFYGRDVSLYMTSLWESWDVIPNIQSRIDDYLTRTLVAVLSANQHVAKPVDETYEIVLNHLKTLAARAIGGQYISAAYYKLKNEREYFLKRTHHRVHIVKLVLAFFYDPATAKHIAKEIPIAGGDYSSFRNDELDSQQIRNPLKFLAKFSTDQQSNTRKSLWILQKLAFAEAP